MKRGHGYLKVVGIGGTLRGIVAPLVVGVSRAWRRTDSEGAITDEDYANRLDKLGGLVVELAEKIGADEPVGALA